MTPQELKNSILQLAIQGKLVEQRKEEGTAEELYKQVLVEKLKLIKEGKIKKEKPLPAITEDEKPFDIPEGWLWIRVGDVFQHNTGKALNGTSGQGSMLTYITTSNLYWDHFELDKLKRMPFTDAEIDKCTVQKNDLLVLEGGDYGRSAIWKYDEPMRIQNHIHRLRNYIEVSVEYFYYAFYLYKNAGLIAGKGIGIQGLSSKALHKLIMPLPPLAEQKRIVVKIEELLPYIDRYEQAWSKLEHLNNRFPVDIQKSILQYAIQGKLVEQLPEEGTAEDLYQKIQVEKQKLIKEGKIKKEKPLPEITEDEKPFDIPDSWKWVRFGEVISLLSGTDFKPEEYNDIHKGIPYITGASGLSQDGVLINRWTETPRILAHQGDVLLVCKGSGYGKTVICDIEQAHIARQIMAIKKSENIHMKYIKAFLQANLKAIKLSGQGVIPGIDRGSILNMAFPLPPLAEQKRIIVMLEKTLPYCDNLKQNYS